MGRTRFAVPLSPAWHAEDYHIKATRLTNHNAHETGAGNEARETRRHVKTRKRREINAYCFRDARKAACPFTSMLALDIAPDKMQRRQGHDHHTCTDADGVAAGQDLG